MKTLLPALFALLTSLTALADAPSVHGMLLFGKNKIYVSHLPMFHEPHDYQLLAELELPPEALAAYRASLGQAPGELTPAGTPGQAIFTLVPERLVLPDLVKSPHPFHADLYRGHFERGGTVLAASLTVSLKRVLFFRKFVPGEAKGARAPYLLFGTTGEAFLAHRITARPDFDQVLEVGASPLVKEGTVVTLEAPGASPLPAPSRLTLHDAQGGELALDAARERYLETGDLE